jgi:hypothetical protein
MPLLLWQSDAVTVAAAVNDGQLHHPKPRYDATWAVQGFTEVSPGSDAPLLLPLLSPRNAQTGRLSPRPPPIV